MQKQVKLTRLVEILQEIGKHSMISQSEKSSSWDFDRSLEYVHTQGLQGHIDFVSRKDKGLPLNSERHIYELDNIVIRNLEIELDDQSAWDVVNDWSPISYAQLYFESCRFQRLKSMMSAFVFPWCGSFRFHSNEFCLPSSHHGGYWVFTFRDWSRVWFVRNNFTGATIQTRCIHTSPLPEGADDITVAERMQGNIAFVANRGVHDLSIQKGYSSIEITGMNRIDRLMVDLVVDLDGSKRTSIYLGPREKIDPYFHNCLQHRSLFLTMRQIAAMNHDSRQLTVLDRQLERIEYFLNKGQDAPSLLEYQVWIEYWQDRALYAWRRWSSDFYRSWLRPLIALVVGYLLINALPAFWIESFLISHWPDFTLRPITEIATYEASLVRIVGDEYDTVSSSAKRFLKLVGILEVVWISVCGFAFAKSIKR